MQEKNFKCMYHAQQCRPKFNVLYENVESCTITYTRTADGPGGYYSDPKPLIKRIDVAHESSMVTIECINTDCTKGYFDLHGVIDGMVNHKETKKSGVLFCDGWQDEERIGVHQCLCKLEYKIQIKYK